VHALRSALAGPYGMNMHVHAMCINCTAGGGLACAMFGCRCCAHAQLHHKADSSRVRRRVWHVTSNIHLHAGFTGTGTSSPPLVRGRLPQHTTTAQLSSWHCSEPSASWCEAPGPSMGNIQMYCSAAGHCGYSKTQLQHTTMALTVLKRGASSKAHVQHNMQPNAQSVTAPRYHTPEVQLPGT
jgi:hypothetical protein